MAVPSSGAIYLFKIAKELEFPDNLGYDNTMPFSIYRDSVNGATPVSLQNMSSGAGGFDSINTANASADRPDGLSPHSMSEFYSYDHDAISLTQVGSSYTGQYSTTSWQGVSIAISAFKGKTVRFIFHYVSGSSYTGDLQIDSVTFPRYYTSVNGGNWQTTTTNTSSYAGASWSNVTVGTTAARWNGRTGGTPSGGTGLSSGSGGSGYYVYAETSAGATGQPNGHPSVNFWLRSGTHDITNAVGTPYFGFQLGRSGATIGTLETYIEEI